MASIPPCTLEKKITQRIFYPKLKASKVQAIFYKILRCVRSPKVHDYGNYIFVFLFVLFTSSSSTLRGLVKNLDGNEIKKYYPKYILQTYYRTAIVKENVWNELWWLIWMDVFPYPIFCHSFEDIWVPTYIGIQKISCIGP